ncbi:MAG: T9SS type A sorting domain-containing protein, partial [Prolixibacteraceae bacterium]|nr:T9SS type A sorting domain-containing protein [Prolixibacteraceae bacterium]
SALEDRLSETEINIFPNPADEKFKVRNSEFKVGDAIVEIYDLNGIKLLEKNIPAGNETTEIDVGSLQNGVYFCRVVMNERSFTKKIIIQKP